MGPAERSGVGIIGAGRLGQAMARTALRAGRLTEMATTTLIPITGTAGACRATGQPRASWYRAHRQSPPPPRLPRPTPRLQPRALGASERQQALEVLHDERCWDAAPASVSATLCWTRAATCARSRRCTGCCAPPARPATGAATPPTRQGSSPRCRLAWRSSTGSSATSPMRSMPCSASLATSSHSTHPPLVSRPL
jgi:hypothetical protein